MHKLHCRDSLSDKGIETRTVPGQKQEGRRKACGAEARSWSDSLAVKVLPTIVGVLSEFHRCW